jgi:hypothetical protein
MAFPSAGVAGDDQPLLTPDHLRTKVLKKIKEEELEIRKE